MSAQPPPAPNQLQGPTSASAAPPETAAVNPLELESRVRLQEAQSQHDLAEEAKKNEHERTKELDALRDRRIIRYIGVVLACFAMAVALIMLLRPGASPSDRDNAWKIIGLVLAAFFGFAFGQATGK